MRRTVSEATSTDDGEVYFESTSFLAEYLRPRLLPWVERNSSVFVPWFQSLCGVYPPAKEVKEAKADASAKDIAEAWCNPHAPTLLRLCNAVVSLLFHFGSLLGHEIVYITFFPFVFWNIDAELGRLLVYLWAITMYIGQGLKDHLKLPRPRHVCAKVRPLERAYTGEFGFPSTHVMAVMGQAVTIVVFTFRKDYAGRGEYPLLMACAIAILFIVVTGASRIYMGVHSLPDVVGGIAITGAALWSFLSFDRYLDMWLLENPEGLYAPTIFFVLLLLLYPRPRKFTVTFGDTATIAGVANGTAISSHLASAWAYPPVPLDWLHVSFSRWLVFAMSRAVVGFMVMALARQVMKMVCTTTLVAALPSSPAPHKERYSVVVPTKFITYTMVSASSVLLCPLVFRYVGLTSEALASTELP